MKRTESSRLMRGAREVLYEYILELHDRMGDPSRSWREMPVTAGEYYDGRQTAAHVPALYLMRQTV